VSLVILFALAFMFIQPWLANVINLSPEVAGAWIGNNIDNTAAVVGAGKLHSEVAMKIASIVKMGQNTLIGVAAFLLALYFSFRKKEENGKVGLKTLWDKFPKFVLGFMALSILASIGFLSKDLISDWISPVKNWLFAMAFVSIGMMVPFGKIKEIGGKPLIVFSIATIFNLATALVLSHIFFGNYTL
jgi:uncharacterized membrane protein YadS